MGNSLYKKLIEIDCKIEGWCSDLWFEVTPQSMAILDKHNKNKSLLIGYSNDRKWFGVLFAYDPYWDKCQETINKRIGL